MSLHALARRVTRMDRGRPDCLRDIEQMTDAELHGAIEREARKTDPALADQLRSASDEERDDILKHIAAGELP